MAGSRIGCGVTRAARAPQRRERAESVTQRDAGVSFRYKISPRHTASHYRSQSAEIYAKLCVLTYKFCQ